MPAIITIHMAKTNANSMARYGACAGAMFPMPAGKIRKPVMYMPPMSMAATSPSK
jgi:hypothetical protein